MFSPIKNFITYIQKNASGNSIFGGNSTTEESTKMETEESLKTENIQIETECEMQDVKEDKEEEQVTSKKEDKEKEQVTSKKEDNDVEKEETCEKDEEKTVEKDDKDTSCEDDEKKSKHEHIKTIITTTTSTVSAENSCEFEDYDDDIEAQIESSIMLKKPVKVAATNGTEILELKRRSSNSGCSIVISHDYNRNQALTPIDDELQDFRNDPTEILGMTSSPTTSPNADEFCSVGSAEEAKERDESIAEDFPTEEEDDEELKGEQKPECVDVDEDESEREPDVDDKDIVEVEDDEEEAFLDLENFQSNDVIVLGDTELNTSNASVDTVNTADDPLAIACEEQEAFAADKAAALEELNLLNTSQTSQDEDTTTTIDDDLQWLKTDLEEPQPSCSSSSNQVLMIKERNGEGSDSGLGSETSALHITTTSITDTSQLNATATATPPNTPTQMKTKSSEKMELSPKSPAKEHADKPFRSNLKRRLEIDDDVDGLCNLTSSSSSSSALSDHSTLSGSLQKKPKRSINFDNVQVYYFPRQQGFSCVPSAGGCTLGMGARHVGFKTLTLAEHAAELRRAHRMQLQEINPRGSSSDDSEESEEDYLSEGSGSDLDGETNGFLQPVSPKQRRALLKAAGIRKIDPSEKADCRNIRNSREVCGCSCRDFCDPETCACSQSGIKCQVDRDMFPCGCSRDACGNTIGRVEFNPARVRTHFIHTLMRLEMENRQQQNPYTSVVATTASSSNLIPATNQTPSTYYQTHLQTQSNYSSGYASPAYNTASELNHQQTAASSYYHPQTPSTSSTLYGQPQQSTLEMTHNSSTPIIASTTPQYGIDSLDASIFGATTPATPPSYGELIPIASYHYANAQSQGAPYNSYHNTTIYHNATATTTLNTPPNTYSSCAVPSIPPYGTATTTEANVIYHSVTNLTTLETTTAPSCNITDTTSLESEVGASFISLSSPMASSSRLSQINDLLQHNRNATTALVAISAQHSPEEATSSLSLSPCSSQLEESSIYSETLTSIQMPDIIGDDALQKCMVYEELTETTLNTGALDIENEKGLEFETTTLALQPIPSLTATKTALISESSILNTEFLSSSIHKSVIDDNDQKEDTLETTLSSETTTSLEVAASN